MIQSSNPTATGPEARQKLFDQIARDVLGIPTLTTRNSDRLDFYDVSVWSVAQALEQAYLVGLSAGQSEAEDDVR